LLASSRRLKYLCTIQVTAPSPQKGKAAMEYVHFFECLLHVITSRVASSSAVTPQACKTAILPMKQYRTEKKKEVEKASTSIKAIPNYA
jgi:hypothetical protein